MRLDMKRCGASLRLLMQLLNVQKNAIKALRERSEASVPEEPIDYELLPVSRLTQKMARRVMKAAPQYESVDRPQRRSDCEQTNPEAIRPCPFVGCKHHTYLSVSETDGRIDVNYPQIHPWEMATRSPAQIAELTTQERNAITEVEGAGALLPSCVLDVVDDLGGTTLELCGLFIDRTRERIRQIELGASVVLREAIASEGFEREDL